MNDNPPNVDAGGRGGRGGNRGQNGQNGQNGNRGQNGQNGQNGNRGDRAQMQTQMITRSLQSAGITDEGTIEAVTTYVANRQAARKPLYDAANALSTALTDEKTTDAQMSQLWDTFQSALDAEKMRTEAAEAELDKQIGYTKNPKLEASLTLLGVTGDASGYLNADQGGRGGMGGQNGGEQNGGGRGGNG